MATNVEAPYGARCAYSLDMVSYYTGTLSSQSVLIHIYIYNIHINHTPRRNIDTRQTSI